MRRGRDGEWKARRKGVRGRGGSVPSGGFKTFKSLFFIGHLPPARHLLSAAPTGLRKGVTPLRFGG